MIPIILAQTNKLTAKYTTEECYHITSVAYRQGQIGLDSGLIALLLHIDRNAIYRIVLEMIQLLFASPSDCF